MRSAAPVYQAKRRLRCGTLAPMSHRDDAAAYQAALHRLLSLADVERMAGMGTSRPKADLSRMRDLARRLGDPQRAAPVLHVAGTKGKGSVASMAASILRAQGLKVGLFTSPHLHTFRERIRIDSGPIAPGAFADALDEIWGHVEAMAREGGERAPTTFEALTGMAFLLFRAQRVDAQVVEVGMGGRLDSTNVADAGVAVITSLSLDHTGVLGDSIERIAAEKAGVIKPGASVVSSPQPPEADAVVEAAAARQGARLLRLGRDVAWQGGARDLTGQDIAVRTPGGRYRARMALLGDHQLENAAAAVAAVEALRPDLTEAAVAEGLACVRWEGRFQVLSRYPYLVVDGAHNVDSVARLRAAVADYLPPGRVTYVFGCSGDKDLPGMAAQLAGAASRVVACTSRHPRSVEPRAVAAAFRAAGVAAEARGSVAEALEAAMAGASTDDSVVVAGSLFVAAEALQAWQGIDGEVYPEFEAHRAAEAGAR